MVYKKYIKKNGRTYGPYIYHSHRVNGKVVSNYHGKGNSGINFKRYKNFVWIFIGLVLIFLSFLFFNNYLSGKAVLDIESNYQEGGNLEGILMLSLKQGEFIPASTSVIAKIGNKSYAASLDNLIDENVVVGNYSIEGKSLLGRGIGYGYGDEFPKVSFVMDVFSKEVEPIEIEEPEEEPTEIKEEKEIPVNETEEPEIEEPEEEESTPEPEEQPEVTEEPEEEQEVEESSEEETIAESKEDSGDEELIPGDKSSEPETSEQSVEPEPTSEPVSEPEPTPEPSPEPSSEGASITGEIISGLFFKVSNLFLGLTGNVVLGEEIKGEVSVDKPFAYNLSEGQTAKIVSSSQDVDLEIKDDKAIVTTDYLGEDEKEILIDLEKLNIFSEQGELVISLVYEDIEIISVSEIIRVKQEEPEEELVNETEKIEPLIEVNITKQNITEENITIVNETIITIANITINTTQYGAVINKPVKWKKNIKLEKPGSVSVELPKEATNIMVFIIEEQVEEFEEIVNETGEIGEQEPEEEEEVEEVSVNETEEIEDTTESSQGDEELTISTFLPEEKIKKEKVSEEKIKIIGKVISGEISADIELEEQSSVFRFFKKIFGFITGRIIDIEEQEEVVEVNIEENATEFEIEYETPAPIAFEQNTSTGKLIVISSEVHYENVLAYTELPYEVSAGAVRLYWLKQENITIENNETPLGVPQNTELRGNDTLTEIREVREEVSVNKYDLNNNSLVDYIEWIVPSLSNQTYELVIEITKAEHLDENRIFISDIYNEVKTKDDNWSEIINNNEYVRVTFEQSLDNVRDITLYARAVNETSSIEVYTGGSNDLITSFENVSEENWYKVYLTNLSGTQNVFDLKILGSVEFDYIYGTVWEEICDSQGICVYKSEKEGIVAEIGNKKRKVKEHEPNLRLSKWDNEVSFNIKPYSEKTEEIKWGKPKIKTEKDSVDMDSNSRKIEWYYKDEAKNNFPILEMEEIIKQKPELNTFSYEIESENLNFYYQPALDIEMNNASCNETDCWDENNTMITHRPEDVVGSYAVYHSSKKNNEYKTGKAFHIYRPKIIDNKGDWIWGEMNITDDKLTITVDQDWLDNAVYPVIIDPTFGYESIGGTDEWAIGSDDIIVTQIFNPTSDGTIDKIWAALYYADQPSREVRLLVYTDVANPVLVDTTAATYDATLWPNGGSPNWKGVAVETGAEIFSGTDYLAGVFLSANFGARYDTVTGNNTYLDTTSVWDTPTDPLVKSITRANHLCSFYVEYTASAGTTLTIWDDSNFSTVYANYTKFYANYSDASGNSINGSSDYYCEFSFNKSKNWTQWDRYGHVNMSFNNVTLQYEIIADSGYIQNASETHIDGMPVGNYSFNVSCYDLGGTYDNVSSVDAVSITEYPTDLIVTKSSESPSVNDNVEFYANYTRTEEWDVTNWDLYTKEIRQVFWNTSDLGTVDSIAYFDCENSGKKDCVAVGEDNSVFMYYSNGSLLKEATEPILATPSIRAFDADNDGYENEIVTVSLEDSFVVYNETGDTVFDSDNEGIVCDNPSMVEVGDFDGDSLRDDIAVVCLGSYPADIIMVFNTTDGKSWGQLWNTTIASSASGFRELHVSDLDKNDIEDVIFCYGTSSLAYLYTFVGDNGTQIFNTTDLGAYSSSCLPIDLNHDGYKDEVLVVNYISIGNAEVYGFRFNGSYNAVYGKSDNITYTGDPQYNIYEMNIADLDDDGWVDDYFIADSGYLGVNGLHIRGYDNNSDTLTLDFNARSNGPNNAYSMSTGDINNDGEDEIIFSETDYDVFYVINKTGSLLFEYNLNLGNVGGLTGTHQATDISDINNDGINDIAVASVDGYAHILQDVNCIIEFNDSTSFNMTWNSTSERWEANRTFASAGTYQYNITCDKGGYVEQLNETNVNVSADTTLPTVNLVAPANNTLETSNSTIMFIYNVSDASTINNCSLFINNVLNGSVDTSITKDTNQSFMRTLHNADFNWSVNCTDEFNNIGASETFNLSVNADMIFPDINFTQPPTPPNDTTTSNTSVEINVSITESNLDVFKWNWNGTNYTLFNGSLVLMMNFDNVSSLGENDTHVVDLSGQGNNGTVTNAVVNTTECKYENCFTFAGVDSDNYISIPDSDLLDFTSGQFTLIAWIYPKSSGDGSNGRIFDKNGGVGNGWTLNMDSNNNFMMQINTNYKSSDTSVITYNQWNHVVATISSSGYIYFYVNGRDAGEGNIGVPPNAHTDPLRIGDRASDDGREFDGNIDEAMIFNRVLSAEEIQILYMSNLNKYAPDKWAFYINQSQNSTDGLVDGKYTYYASAKDGLGNENMTEERTLKIEAPLVNISLIYPTTNIDVSQNEFFNVTVNVSCVAGTCGTVNVSLDPEMIKNIIGVDEQVNVQVDGEVDEEGQIVENNFEGKSFFERVVGFITSKWDLMRGLFV